MVEAALILSRWLHEAAVTGLFGLALFRLHAPRTAPFPAGLRTVCALLALLAGLGWFYFAAASMGGGLGEALATIPTVLSGTDFGPLWMARLALALVLCVPALQRRPRPYATLAGLLLASLALTGHPRMHEGWAGWVHAADDALHLLAAGAWLGALAAFLLLLRRAPRDVETTRALADFARTGSITVAVLLATGIVNAALILGGIAPLATTFYGRLLCLKIAAFGLMLALAAFNRFRLVPRLAGAPTLARLRRNVTLELALGVMVLLIVAVIGTLDPSV
ncbi:MAG: copper homeostasis membrane protein CopD [Phenylobacterium sp.]